MLIQLLLLGIAPLTSAPAHATDDSVPGDPVSRMAYDLPPSPVSRVRDADWSREARRLLSPQERFELTQEVYARFSVEPEPDSQSFLDSLHGLVQPERFASRLPYLDPNAQWERFTETTDVVIAAYQDRDSWQQIDFGLRLADNSLESDWMRDLRARLVAAPESAPLAGLKVAIDPGHMGGDEWDRRTGKFVSGVVNGRRRKLSEGVLATQTALLIERDLVTLGASVLLTRRGLGPVSDMPYDDLDVRTFGRAELRASSLLPWFQSLLELGVAAFERSSQVATLFSEQARGRYFILREDIDARARKIRDFDPDVTLVIHFDAVATELGTTRLPYTKAYVEGAVLPEEFATREARADIARHLYHPDGWDASVDLSERVVTQLSRRLRLQPSTHGGSPHTRRVRPGVFARNLGLTRKLPGHALTYLECLFYNDPVEFPLLLREDHVIDIDGRPTPYSERLARVAEAIVIGVRDFAASLR